MDKNKVYGFLEWYNYCAVKMDDETYRNLPTMMWCGYFETLYKASIVTLQEYDEDTVHF